jgi:hypothetical protein
VVHHAGHLQLVGGAFPGRHIRGRPRLHLAAALRHTRQRGLAAAAAAAGTRASAAQAAQRGGSPIGSSGKAAQQGQLCPAGVACGRRRARCPVAAAGSCAVGKVRWV